MTGRDKPPYWMTRVVIALAALPFFALVALLQTGAASAVDLRVVASIALASWSAGFVVARYCGVWPFSR